MKLGSIHPAGRILAIQETDFGTRFYVATKAGRKWLTAAELGSQP